MVLLIDVTYDIDMGSLKFINLENNYMSRPPLDVAVLDFQIHYCRSETPALYLRSLLNNQEGRGRKLGTEKRA